MRLDATPLEIIWLERHLRQNILTSCNWPTMLAASKVSLTNASSAVFRDEDNGQSQLEVDS